MSSVQHGLGSLKSVAASERRRYTRYKMAVQIELRPEGTGFPIRLQTSDLSCGGCYLEMAFTLEVGRRVEIVMWIGDKKLVAKGMVVSCHPQFGNGIEFTEISNEQRDQLEEFLIRAAQEGERLPH